MLVFDMDKNLSELLGGIVIGKSFYKVINFLIYNNLHAQAIIITQPILQILLQKGNLKQTHINPTADR